MLTRRNPRGPKVTAGGGPFVFVLAVAGSFLATTASAPVAGGTPAPARQASGPSLPASVSTSTIKAVLRHPCTLLSESQADAAAHVRFAQEFDDAKTGLCEYVANPSGNSTINIYIETGPVTAELPPSFANSFYPEASLGRGVVWVVEKGGARGSGELWFPLGKVGSASYSVQIQLSQGGLGEAAAIARDCFSHL